MKGIKLFCLPYAGSSAAKYAKWRNYLESSIKLCPVEFAGRGGRIKEPYYDSMSDAVEDILRIIDKETRDSEYAIFGHSMGSTITYELICRLKEKSLRLPVHAFFSGRYPPCIKKKEKNRYLLTDEKLLQEAVNLGGIPAKLMRYTELVQTAINTLRADYKVLETYGHNPVIHKFSFNISVLSGSNDELADKDDMKKWEQYTEKNCTFYTFNGGHFYLNDCAEEIAKIINNTLSVIE
jgi:Predicted thioesterase involved in non-ribosomal peptide biosynthesis